MVSFSDPCLKELLVYGTVHDISWQQHGNIYCAVGLESLLSMPENFNVRISTSLHMPEHV